MERAGPPADRTAPPGSDAAGNGEAAGFRVDEPLLTVDELARLLAVKPGWVYAAVRDGVLPHVRVGKHLRFVRRDIDRWVLENRTP